MEIRMKIKMKIRMKIRMEIKMKIRMNKSKCKTVDFKNHVRPSTAAAHF